MGGAAHSSERLRGLPRPTGDGRDRCRERLHIQPRPVSVSATTCDRIGHNPEAAKGTWNWDVSRLNVEEFGAAWVRFSTGLVLLFKTSWAVHIDSLGRSYFLGDRGGVAMDPLEV